MKVWKGYQRGVNLGGWLSQCVHTKEHYDSFIQEKDIKNISSWGADHVRLPIDYELVQKKDGSFIEDGFAYLQNAIDWCEKYGLNLVLDLHKTAGYSFDTGEKEDGFWESTEYQEHFYQLWEELARRYAGYRDRVAFELLNEVVEQSVYETWNQIAAQCIQRIRAISKDIQILVGGYWNNSVAAVPDLLLPPDEYIIYNFHCYEPLVFTHQGAHWVNGMPLDFTISFNHTVQETRDASTMIEPGWLAVFEYVKDMDRPLDSQFFKDIFENAVQVAEERGTTLYCGEYGVIDTADHGEITSWYRAIHQAFEELGIGRAAWSYKEMNFGLSDDAQADMLEDIKPLL